MILKHCLFGAVSLFLLHAPLVLSAPGSRRTDRSDRPSGHALLVRKLSCIVDASLVQSVLNDPRCAIDRSIMFRKQGKREDYSYLFADSSIADGRRFFADHRTFLDSLERTYVVLATVLVAVYRAETDFGRYLGKYTALKAIYTGYFRMRTERRRREEFNQLAAFLELVRSGTVDTFATVSSWRGAFGLTQFRPASYVLAVDWDRDGRADLFSEKDALASAANYLMRRGYGAYNGGRYRSAILEYARIIADGADTAPVIPRMEPLPLNFSLRRTPL